METSSAFFYGTLMHPKILKRVIGNNANHLQICSAVLLNYTRHQIKHADYPGIIPYSRSRPLFDRDLNDGEKSVRGTFVTGLSRADMASLDVFEGDEYTRELVDVYPLAPAVDIGNISLAAYEFIVPSKPSPLPETSSLQPPVKAATYVYKDLTYLQPSLWSYQEFIENNAWKWIGRGAQENEDYLEVDRRRDMNGSTTGGAKTEPVVDSAAV